MCIANSTRGQMRLRWQQVTLKRMEWKKNRVGSRRLSLPNLIFFPSPAMLVKPRLVEHFREICYVQWKEYVLFP